MSRSRRRFLVDLRGAVQLGVVGVAGCRRSADECRVTAPDRVETVVAAEVAESSEDGHAALVGSSEGIAAIATTEFESRIEQVRARLSEHKLGAVVVEAGVDLTWLGGPRWGRSERPLLLVVPAKGEPRLLGPAFEAGTLAARAGGLEFESEFWHEHEDPYALARKLLDDRGAAGPVVVGSDTRIFVVEGLRGAAPKRGFHPALDVLEPLRRCKTPAELAILRRANEVTKLAIASAAQRLREGMSEAEFSGEMTAALEAGGLTDCWVLALFGANAAFPHGTPDPRSLGDGDLVLVDTGGFLHGYASDITRTWAFGDPSRIDVERRRAWTTVRDAQAAALAVIRPGVRCGEVDAAARAVVRAAGYDPDYGHFTHRLGHGIGMQVHEPPYLVRGGEHRLEPGNTMSNEPGIYVPHRSEPPTRGFGIRLEDIVAVTDDGVEVFGPLSESLDRPFG